jgi:hypothetical protein
MALAQWVLPAVVVAAFAVIAALAATGRLKAACSLVDQKRRRERPWSPRAPVHPSRNGHVRGWQPADGSERDRKL